MIDASHGNSLKQHERQFEVADAAARQLEAGERRIVGVMVESNLVGGRQDLTPGRQLAHGQSITDACLGWAESVRLLDRLAAGVRGRRACSTPDSHALPTRP
jgi:3-deoxy-7-phosphoheptulonate synthase